MFGARIQLRADMTLAEISSEVAALAELTRELARVAPS